MKSKMSNHWIKWIQNKDFKPEKIKWFATMPYKTGDKAYRAQKMHLFMFDKSISNYTWAICGANGPNDSQSGFFYKNNNNKCKTCLKLIEKYNLKSKLVAIELKK